MSTVVLGNGTMVHSYDFDDYHMTKIHPGAVVMPAAVACGENEHCDGKSLLTAIVAGYETMIHIARGINPAASRLKGWHLTGTCGTFAAAAAVGNMWGFDPQTMASALGMAGTQSAGLWAFTADGSFSKRFHAGRSAQSGVIAASLARLGYCGPTKILEADDGGFFKATSEDFEFFKVIDGLGVKYDVEDVIIKPYPICGSLHSSIDAVLALKKENDIVVSEIEEIIVYNSEVVNLQCGFNYKPAGILQAQMSMKYCVARAVTDGLFTVSQLTEEKVSDPFVVDLAGRVTFVRDDEINKIYPLEFPSIVEIIMKNGKRLKKKIDSPTGSKENPLSWEAVQEKFKIHAPPVIGMNKSEKLIQVIDNLEDVNDVAVLSALMK
jgi:2-methylcitrate dehydratase PrpD